MLIHNITNKLICPRRLYTEPSRVLCTSKPYNGSFNEVYHINDYATNKSNAFFLNIIYIPHKNNKKSYILGTLFFPVIAITNTKRRFFNQRRRLFKGKERLFLNGEEPLLRFFTPTHQTKDGTINNDE